MTDPHKTDIEWIKDTLSNMSDKLDSAMNTFETKDKEEKSSR